MDYKQGMSELLLMLVKLYKLVCDGQMIAIQDKGDYVHLHPCNSDETIDSQEMAKHQQWTRDFGIKAENAESDCFVLFKYFLERRIKEFYVYEPAQSGVKSGIRLKSYFIYRKLLRHSDVSLYRHLSSLKLEPLVQVLKWLRLVFIRTFEFWDVLTLWHTIIQLLDREDD